MIKLSNKPLLALICFVCIIAASTSCKKNNDVADKGIVQLLSFGPTGAKPLDTLSFIGIHLEKVTTIQFTGTNAVVDQKDFKQQSADLILLVVPRTTEKGYVTLKTPDGDIVTKTMLNLKVASVENSMTTQARPGENITITGQYLNWVTKVTFADTKEVSTFVSKTESQLVVTVPVDAQTGVLILSYKGTDTADVKTKDTLKVTLPVAISFSPNPIKHQTNLTITGTDIDLVKKVSFNGVATPVTTFVSQSATQLVVVIPTATTKGKVMLESASGIKTTSSTDLDVMLPSVAAISPNPIEPGTNLTITGTNLDLASSVTFQNAAAVTTFVSQTATQIVVKAPVGITKGKITLGVLNSTLTVQSTDVLDVIGAVPPPTISFPIYNDAVTANWNGWIGGGWGGTSDRNNTTPSREGVKSIQISYVGGYGSPLQLGGASISLTPYTSFKLSVYGAVGSAGKTITLGINGVNGKYNISVVEGKWTDYAIPIATLTTDAILKEIWVQEYSGTGGFTVFVDALGLN